MYMAIISPARSREAKVSGQLASEQTAIAGDRAQLAQLQALAANQPAQLQRAFRLAEAVPVGDQTPGMILELQALAKASDVTLTQVRTISTTPVNNLVATVYEVDVVGRFFNVDDFLYRVHHQVSVTSNGAVAIKGRLFAVTGLQMTLAGASGATSSSPNAVEATLQLMTFSTDPSSSASSGSGSTGSSSSSGTSTTPSSSGGLG